MPRSLTAFAINEEIKSQNGPATYDGAIGGGTTEEDRGRGKIPVESHLPRPTMPSRYFEVFPESWNLLSTNTETISLNLQNNLLLKRKQLYLTGPWDKVAEQKWP